MFRSSTERLVAPLLAKVRYWSSLSWIFDVQLPSCDCQKWVMVQVGSGLPSQRRCLSAAVSSLFLLFFFSLFLAALIHERTKKEVNLNSSNCGSWFSSFLFQQLSYLCVSQADENRHLMFNILLFHFAGKPGLNFQVYFFLYLFSFSFVPHSNG